MKGTGLCPHRSLTDIDPIFYGSLEELEKRCGFEFTVTRICYCPECNLKIGGAPHSAHLKESHEKTTGMAKAADICIDNSRQRFLIVKNAIEMGFCRIEPRETWVHVDRGSELDGFAQDVMFLK